MTPDSLFYIELAEILLDSQTFPSIFRTPVYPSFIALIFGIFGHFPQAVVASQIFLDSLTAVLVFFIFLETFGKERYAYGAGFFYAVSPFSIYYSNVIRSEILFACIMTAAVYFFIVFLKKKQKRYLFASSLSLGVGILCRPIALYLPLLLTPLVFSESARIKEKLANCAVFWVAIAIILIPWYIRNDQQYGYRGISTVKDSNMFYFEATAVLMIKDDPSSAIKMDINETFYKHQMHLWETVKKKYGWEAQTPITVLDDAEKTAILRGEGMKIVQEHTFYAVLAHTAGMGRTLCPYPPHFERLTGSAATGVRWFAFLTDAAIMGLSLFGIISTARRTSHGRGGKIALLIMILLIFYFSFIPGIMGYPRFKVPVMPLICIFASYGLGRMGKDL